MKKLLILFMVIFATHSNASSSLLSDKYVSKVLSNRLDILAKDFAHVVHLSNVCGESPNKWRDKFRSFILSEHSVFMLSQPLNYRYFHTYYNDFLKHPTCTMKTKIALQFYKAKTSLKMKYIFYRDKEDDLRYY